MVKDTRTSIGVKITTKERLQKIGSMNETFDDLLNRLCGMEESMKEDHILMKKWDNAKTNKEREEVNDEMDQSHKKRMEQRGLKE